MRSKLEYINYNNLISSLIYFKNAKPFDHCVIDNFFMPNVAEDLEKDFPDFESIEWYSYKNKIEDKKTLNDWNKFPSLTTKVFNELMSPTFLKILEKTVCSHLYIDPSLHGGGWHIHGPGGNLNPHLDYIVHPKLKLLRKLNIIIYLSSTLNENDGGHLGFWNTNANNFGPGNLQSEVFPKFNRAVLFDTTQNSWHGMSKPLANYHGVLRKSLAIYYLTDPSKDVDKRERALFAPRENQKGDKEIQELIETRSDSNRFHTVYIHK